MMELFIFMVSKVLLSAFYLFTVYQYMKIFLGEARKGWLKTILWSTYFIFQVVYKFIQFLSPQFFWVITTISLMILAYFSFHDSPKKSFLFSVIINVVWMIAEVIVMLFLKYSGMSERVLIDACGFLATMMMLFILQILKRRAESGEILGRLSTWRFIVLMLVPLFSALLIHVLFCIANKYLEFSGTAVMTGLVLLVINYMIFGIYEWLVQSAGMKEQMLLYERQLELYQRQTQEREKRVTEQRQLRHDMKHHLIAILGVAKHENSVRTSSYIKALLEEWSSSGRESRISGNSVVDSLLGYYREQAEEYNIRFECEAKLPEDLPFEAGRLTVIFGNLLDNALEGSRKTEDAWILIKVSYEKGVLFLNIRNICDSKQLKFSDGKYITTKQEPENHGYGLKSVKQAVEAYSGSMEVECKDNVFDVALVLFPKSDMQMGFL